MYRTYSNLQTDKSLGRSQSENTKKIKEAEEKERKGRRGEIVNRWDKGLKSTILETLKGTCLQATSQDECKL